MRSKKPITIPKDFYGLFIFVVGVAMLFHEKTEFMGPMVIGFGIGYLLSTPKKKN